MRRAIRKARKTMEWKKLEKLVWACSALAGVAAPMEWIFRRLRRRKWLWFWYGDGANASLIP